MSSRRVLWYRCSPSMAPRPAIIARTIGALALAASCAPLGGCDRNSIAYRSTYELAGRESIAFRIRGRDVATTLTNQGTVDLEIALATLDGRDDQHLMLIPGNGPTTLTTAGSARLSITNHADERARLAIESIGRVDLLFEPIE